MQWTQKRQHLTDLIHTNAHITAWSHCWVLGKLLTVDSWCWKDNERFWTRFKAISVQSERIPATDENYPTAPKKTLRNRPNLLPWWSPDHFHKLAIWKENHIKSKHHHQVCYIKKWSFFQLHLITVQFSSTRMWDHNGHPSFMCSPGHPTIIQLTDLIRVLMF